MSMGAQEAVPTRAERIEAGRAARRRHPRRDLGEYVERSGRPSPVALLGAQERDRVPELLPVRHERMAQTPFTFLRGAAAVMADDLGSRASTGLTVQLCGDAHLANLGLFGAPDRGLVFDVNDFDETSPGPFEWDVMRLATSFVVAAEDSGHRRRDVSLLPREVARSYREMMSSLSGLTQLEEWYYRLDVTMLRQWAEQSQSRAAVRAVSRTARAAQSRDSWSAVRKLTEVVDGERRFRDQPPLLVSLGADGARIEVVQQMLDAYLSTLLVDRATLLSRYRVVDVGHKVVGVGSVGLLAFVLLLQGRDAEDLLVLQIKQAVPSVLEAYTAPSTWPTPGKRVVAGQRLMQAATDAFLGWTDGPQGRSYYVRQLRDMKWSPDIATMTPTGLLSYAGLCGAALARAHARSGDSVAISAYMGESSRFESMIQAFALQYAEQNARDFHAYTAAIASGEVPVTDDASRAVRMSLQPGNPQGPLVITEVPAGT